MFDFPLFKSTGTDSYAILVDVADTGLRIMLELWKNVSHSSVAIPFVQV